MRLFVLIVLVLLVPIVPFVLFHETLEQSVQALIDRPPSTGTVVMIVFGLLAVDVILPIPSSLVSTLAGGQLGPAVATLTSWIGLNAGAVCGCVIGRRVGRPLAERLTKPVDLERIDLLLRRFGTGVLVLTRALPILAEATVLFVGVSGMSWKRFLPPVVLSNLGIALAYSILGHYAAKHEWLAFAASVSVALPLLITFLVRRLIK